jgi:hypothetical protein
VERSIELSIQGRENNKRTIAAFLVAEFPVQRLAIAALAEVICEWVASEEAMMRSVQSMLAPNERHLLPN